MSETSELFEAFEADPTNHKAFEALVKHLIEQDDTETLGTVYDRLPEWAQEPTSRLLQVLNQKARMAKGSSIASFLHYRNGLLLWKQFDDPRKAEMCFRKVKTVPDDPTPLREFYLQFYAEQENWRRLEQFLNDPELGGVDDPVEVKRTLARLCEERENKDKGAVFWAAVLSADPDDAEAEAALRRLYVDIGKWHALVDLVKDNLKRLGPDQIDEQIALHREMIDIYKTRLNAAPKAVSEWQAILEIDEANQEALDALAHEYSEMRRWPDLVKVLRLKIRHETDTDQVIELHRQVASIMRDKFNNPTEAIVNIFLEQAVARGGLDEVASSVVPVVGWQVIMHIAVVGINLIHARFVDPPEAVVKVLCLGAEFGGR